jgi:hypothetical protein
MNDLSRKIDTDYFRASCKVAAANTKGQGQLTFLRPLSAWLHDRAVEASFKPTPSNGEREKQYLEAIVERLFL